MSYGIQIFNANGTSEIFGYNVAGAHFIGSGTIPDVPAGATRPTGGVSIEGLTSTNTGSVGVSVMDNNPNSLGTPVTVNRDSPSAGKFTVTNNSNAQASFEYFAFRL